MPTASNDPEISEAFKPQPESKAKSVVQGREKTEGLTGFINGVSEIAGKSIANLPYEGARGAVDLARRWTGGDTNAPEPSWVRSLNVPLSDNARRVAGAVGDAVSDYVPDRLPGDPTSGDVNEAATFGQRLRPIKEYVAPVVKDVASIAPLAAGATNVVRASRAASEVGSAQDVANQAFASQSMGAAGTAPNLASASPQLQKAVTDAARKNGGAVNADALQAHLEADSHGVQLMRGQATRDAAQFSEEQNSTDPRIVKRLTEQNDQMRDAIDAIRRDASPTTVGNTYIDNGRAAVDALKAYDEPIKANISAKYKALVDANGGSVPIDTGTFLDNVDSQLKKQFKTSKATEVPEIRDILGSIRAGEPLDFEGYEAARSALADVMRGPDKGARVAAGIVRNNLEQLPLSPEAAHLKGLADDARAAAKSRFDALESDPAYKAAVDDVEAGNARGAPTPLADTFLDKYALSKSAPKSQLDLMMQKIRAADPEAAGAVESHTLNAIRKSAVNSSGIVMPKGINDAMDKFGPKLDSLVQPETRDKLESLGRVITNAKVAPPGNYVNYSKSGAIINAAKGVAEGAINAKTGGAYGFAKHLFTGDKFVKDALAPGAGIDQLKAK